MATADDYAKWIVDNEDQQGTADFETVVRAYEEAKAQESKERPSAVENIATQVAGTSAVKSVPAATNFAARLPANIIDEGIALAKTAKQMGWEGAKTLGNQWMETPVKTSGDIAKSWAQGHATLGPMLEPLAGKTAMQGAGVVGRGALGLAGQALAAPENAFMLPYNMAAYEQAKIRQNPNAPQYANNPYAQTVRGEAPTQGVAGSMNAQKALIGQQYGGLNPQEQAIMQAESQRQMAIQQKKQQARMVLQQPPTAKNFIERSKALAELYGNVGQ